MDDKRKNQENINHLSAKDELICNVNRWLIKNKTNEAKYNLIPVKVSNKINFSTKGIDKLVYIFESHRGWIDGLINYSFGNSIKKCISASTITNTAINKMMRAQ